VSLLVIPSKILYHQQIQISPEWYIAMAQKSQETRLWWFYDCDTVTHGWLLSCRLQGTICNFSHTSPILSPCPFQLTCCSHNGLK